jgi:hypothetical protein
MTNPNHATATTKIPARSPSDARATDSPMRDVSGQPYGGEPYLPTDPAERKAIPICTGVLDYFPLALIEVAKVSEAGNRQHNPGEPLHWARGKSMDQADTAVRHIMERGGIDVDGKRHLAKAAWRILADLQIEMERELGKPIARGATAA